MSVNKVMLLGNLGTDPEIKEFDNGNSLAKFSLATYLEGKIQTRSWEDQDGNKRYTTEIVSNNFQMLAGKVDSDKAVSNADSPQKAAPAKSKTAKKQAVQEDPDDDLPF